MPGQSGPPGCGKTTVVRRVVERLKNRRLAGFYTQELRQHGQRVGFEAVTRVLDEPVAVLATIAAKGGGFIAQAILKNVVISWGKVSFCEGATYNHVRAVRFDSPTCGRG